MWSVELEAQRHGAVAWRNNSGAALTREGRPVRYGLGNTSPALNEKWKSSDYIGMMPDGRLLAMELKPAGWTFRGTPHERAQAAFLEDVRRRGGVAGFVTCPEDVARLVRTGGRG